MRFMAIVFKRLTLVLLILFVVPAMASLAVWQADASKPRSWRDADWTSANILPPAATLKEAQVHIMAAKTGRWKGAFSVHSWLVLKKPGTAQYDRYDVVGWGRPVRHNAYAADARWYSNDPEVIHTVKGADAERLISKIERAVSRYPEAERGDYVLWPGPNSNSFVSYVLNNVPELGIALPPNAVGRDWLGNKQWLLIDDDWRNLQVSFGGYAGFALGVRHGFELNFLGLVTGIDVYEPGLKLPGFGRIGFGL